MNKGHIPVYSMILSVFSLDVQDLMGQYPVSGRDIGVKVKYKII